MLPLIRRPRTILDSTSYERVRPAPPVDHIPYRYDIILTLHSLVQSTRIIYLYSVADIHY